MKNTPNQEAKGLKKEEKETKAKKAKIANLSPEDVKGITGGQRCGGVSHG